MARKSFFTIISVTLLLLVMGCSDLTKSQETNKKNTTPQPSSFVMLSSVKSTMRQNKENGLQQKAAGSQTDARSKDSSAQNSGKTVAAPTELPVQNANTQNNGSTPATGATTVPRSDTQTDARSKDSSAQNSGKTAAAPAELPAQNANTQNNGSTSATGATTVPRSDTQTDARNKDSSAQNSGKTVAAPTELPIPHTIRKEEVHLQTGASYSIPSDIASAVQEYIIAESEDCIGIQSTIVTARRPGTGTLTAKGEHLTVYFTFTVTPDSGITVDKDRIDIKGRERKESIPSVHTVKVTRQTEYTDYNITSVHSWITWEKTTDGLTDVYTFKIDNKSFFDRSTQIKFTSASGKFLKAITVVQDGNYTIKKNYKWVKGVQEPELNTLTSYYNMYYEWEENQNTTWFHVVKLANSGILQEKNDASLCWAMTGANMLHWWLEQNKDNIKKYLEMKGITENDPDYEWYTGKYNRNVRDSQKSNIAQLARTHLGPGANATRFFLTWYLLGKDFPDQRGIKNYKKAPGYFKDVFKDTDADNSYILMDRSVFSQQTLEAEINEAFAKGEAIAIDYRQRVGRHIITVWGASYDDAGQLVELWVADSNIGPEPRLQNRGICYKDGRPYFVNLSSKSPNYNEPIDGVLRLNPRSEQFEAFFQQGK